MKFPKVWNSPSGQSLTGGLAESEDRYAIDGAPYQTQFGPGYAVYHQGLFDTITLDDDDSGYFSVGDLGVAGQSIVVTSASGHGGFADIGTFAGSGYAFPEIVYVGGGVGTDLALTGANDSYGGAIAQVYQTANGKTFKPAFSFGSNGDAHASTHSIQVAAAVGANGYHTFGWGITHAVGGFRMPFYTYTTDGGATQLEVALPSTAGFDHAVPVIARIGPTSLLGVIVIYGPTSGALPPFPLVITSNDNGATWSTIDGTGLWSGYNTTGMSVATYNQNMSTMPAVNEPAILPTGSGNALLCFPFYSVANGYNFILATFASGAISVSGSLPYDSRYFSVRPVKVYQQLIYQFESPAFPALNGFTLVSTDGGSTWTQNVLPSLFQNCGAVSVLDQKTVVVPIYDGNYSLYQSLDFGVTWTLRATLYNNATATTQAPAPTSGYAALPRFGALTYMRRNGSPAYLTPGMPWISDSRVTPLP